MSKIIISISYAGLMLPVYKDDAGKAITPFKTIVVNVLGLNWETQREKVTKSEFLRRELGLATPLKGGSFPQNQEPLCIRINRIAYYLMTVNPDRVRANGNIPSAEYLEQKISEWADALHDYEEIGVAVNLNHVKHQELLLKQQRHIAQLIAIKNKTEPPHDRKLLEQMIGSGAKESGLVYQPDLIDTGSS
jgi:hypothetical protein